VVILDVGHGNSAVLLDTEGVVVIDAGKKGVLIDFLRQLDVKCVDVLLVSHADSDHVLNAEDVLLDDTLQVRVVCYNSDASKTSRAWQSFRKAIKEARRNKNTNADPQLTTSQTGRLDRGLVHVEVLYPYPETAASGPGGVDEEGEPITSNSMSAVVRLTTDKGNMVMLAGDVEPGCLKAWEDENLDPTAFVLVYPHHGGNPGDNDRVAYAVALAKAIKPKTVIFSINRTQYELPRPDVVAAFRANAPGVYVACTQLSRHCSETTPATNPTHLTMYQASGRSSNACCAGTIVIDLSGIEPLVLPQANQHMKFIDSLTRQPLCKR
jgi:beta-lactamase superfamily II metal-dependent hydrolase